MPFETLPKFSAGLLAILLAQPSALVVAQDESSTHRNLVNKYHISPDLESLLSPDAIARLIHEKVKYVFVLYQENRSFDSYFGTFSRAKGLNSHPASRTPSFTQQLVNTGGTVTKIQPIRIGPTDQCLDSTVNDAATTACSLY